MTQWIFLALGLLVTVMIYDRGGALGAFFLLIIVFGLLRTGEKRGLI